VYAWFNTSSSCDNLIVLRGFRIPKLTPEEKGIIPKKPAPHTTATSNHTDPATQVVVDAT
jgi:hypothetical protein